MYCPKCGKKTEETLCPNCGCNLKTFNTDDEEFSNSSNTNKKIKKASKIPVFITIFSVVMAVVVIINLIGIKISHKEANVYTNSFTNSEVSSKVSSAENDLTVIDETNTSSDIISSEKNDNSNITSSIKKEESPIDISKITFHINILPPNLIGTVYAQLTYDNFTGYDITFLSVTALLKDKNEKTYYTCIDTVLSGETSSIFNSFGPDTQSLSDIEFLKCEIVSTDKNGKRISIKYDYKLKTYDVI